MADSQIEWTDKTINPVTGCTRVSDGCDLCYAVSQTRRAASFGFEKYKGLVNPGKNHFNGVVKLHPEVLLEPYGWRKPQRIFVCSMSDLLHPGVPTSFVLDFMKVARDTPRHQYQLLTKRPERLAEIDDALDAAGGWPANVLMGTSVEDARVLDRVDHLRSCGARVKYISAEPLIGPLTGIDLDGIHWLIAGGESGGGARRMEAGWAREIRDICVTAGVAFFFKQWGRFDESGRRMPNKKAAGRLLDGREWNEHPLELATA